MAGFRNNLFLASVALIIGTAPSAYAQRDWWDYGYYGPVYYAPAYSTYPVYGICTTAPPRAPSASPTPATPPASKASPKAAIKAPASVAKEPPVQAEPYKKGPLITESRSPGGSYGEVKTASGRCKVGFWNVTGHDVTLTIAGKRQTLPKDRAVTLELDRTFNWQVGEREAVTERVPEGEAFHEVILRE